MSVYLRTVEFKSKSPYFDAEYTDVKNNTARTVTPDDSRFKVLKAWADGKEDLGFIVIKHTEKPMRFKRLLKSVIYYDKMFILTWFPYCEHDYIQIDKWIESNGLTHYEFYCRYCLRLEVRSIKHGKPIN